MIHFIGLFPPFGFSDLFYGDADINKQGQTVFLDCFTILP